MREVRPAILQRGCDSRQRALWRTGQVRCELSGKLAQGAIGARRYGHDLGNNGLRVSR